MSSRIRRCDFQARGGGAAVVLLVSAMGFLAAGPAAASVSTLSGRSSGAPDLRPAKQVPSASVPLDLLSFLPKTGEAPGWSPTGEPLVYKGDELFTYIDGGADIYKEYGFKQVAVQDYADASRHTVTLEIFEMDDAAAAFGMFTFKTSARGSEVALGQGGRLEDYYLNFWKGPILVTVTGFDESPASGEAVRKIAAIVDGKVKAAGDKPALAAAFPADWAARGGLKYIRGPVGLRNLHPAFARLSVRFLEGVAGSPADGLLAAVLRGRSPADAADILTEAQKTFSASPPFSDYQGGAGRFSARDAKGDRVDGRLLDGVLGILVSKAPAAASEDIWDRLRRSFSPSPR